ncbi:ComF family protein [Paenibacillus sp. P96]|uniref:ComF family protein n=1 Tax=Paenibacillus zeirhizosphaerae TaxID=2987519 RepID=A0ABT9FV74_9BACL|nr:ComF family protein [Paenibacillus sp. P96]MDP4098605.1 ComF family protein [Paenibacillus sp. P96]
MPVVTLASIGRHLLELLKPPVERCLTCGGRAVLNAGLPGICSRCAQRIPWIGRIRCNCCGRPVGCPDCLRPDRVNRAFVCNRSAVAYTAEMKEWISWYKYRGEERYEPLLAAMLGRAYTAMQSELTFRNQGTRARESTSFPRLFAKKWSGHKKEWWQADLMTCVPVSEARLADRGFNQAERLAVLLAADSQVPFCPLLVRNRDTGKQSFKSRSERGESMKAAFSVLPGIGDRLWEVREYRKGSSLPNPPLRVLLVDDIYTTGSTLEACSRVLRSEGEAVGLKIEVYGLTWARS